MASKYLEIILSASTNVTESLDKNWFVCQDQLKWFHWKTKRFKSNKYKMICHKVKKRVLLLFSLMKVHLCPAASTFLLGHLLENLCLLSTDGPEANTLQLWLLFQQKELNTLSTNFKMHLIKRDSYHLWRVSLINIQLRNFIFCWTMPQFTKDRT